MTSAARQYIQVAVGVILNCRDEVLIARRAAHLPQGGLWEFPGGKVEAGESVSAALRRELVEEVGITVQRQFPFKRIYHQYSDRCVCLNVQQVTEWTGAIGEVVRERHKGAGQYRQWSDREGRSDAGQYGQRSGREGHSDNGQYRQPDEEGRSGAGQYRQQPGREGRSDNGQYQQPDKEGHSAAGQDRQQPEQEYRGREGQLMKWVPVSELRAAAFPSANEPIIRALQLPRLLAITPQLSGVMELPELLDHYFSTGVRLLQLRQPQLAAAEYAHWFQQALPRCQEAGVLLLANQPLAALLQLRAACCHLNSKALLELKPRPDFAPTVLTASCHNQTELVKAERLGVDLVLLSSVQYTAKLSAPRSATQSVQHMATPSAPRSATQSVQHMVTPSAPRSATQSVQHMVTPVSTALGHALSSAPGYAVSAPARCAFTWGGQATGIVCSSGVRAWCIGLARV